LALYLFKVNRTKQPKTKKFMKIDWDVVIGALIAMVVFKVVDKMFLDAAIDKMLPDAAE